jgi:hypothetical protein
MITPEGNRFADAVANYIHDNAIQPHRGAVPVIDSQTRRVAWVAAFGNDGYTDDERTQRYVTKLRAQLGRSRPVDAGLCAEGYTWVILVPVALGENYRVVLSTVDGDVHGQAATEWDGLTEVRVQLDRDEIIEATGGKPIEISDWQLSD